MRIAGQIGVSVLELYSETCINMRIADIRSCSIDPFRIECQLQTLECFQVWAIRTKK